MGELLNYPLNCNIPDSLFQYENMESNNFICPASSKKEIQEKIKNLKNHKAQGKNGIPGELLKIIENGLFDYVIGLIKEEQEK